MSCIRIRRDTALILILSVLPAVSPGPSSGQTPALESPAVQSRDGGSLYGTVVTVSGDEFQGYIRWDRNEAAWSDVLHASKLLPERNLDDALDLGVAEAGSTGQGIEVLGFRVPWGEEERWSPEALSAVRFGHVRSIEVLDEDRAIVVLKSGIELEMFASSTDLGGSNRGIEIADAEGGTVSLAWADVALVDFSSAPEGFSSTRGPRLYGTLRTQSGDMFTGFVGWDNDEVFGSDLLDGEADDGDRSIPFSHVAVIEQDGRDGAMVTLRDGETFRLEDSNDVNHENRGIVISDPRLGEVTVSWEGFASLTFHAAPDQDYYAAFDGGRSLFGTVRAASGDRLTGYLRWDNDEEFTWEMLDGESRGVDFDVELANVARIERIDDQSALVILRDGRTFQLSGSNDVNEENKGVFVIDESGEVRVVVWSDLEGVSFRDARGASSP
jgi:hypothetical protein